MATHGTLDATTAAGVGVVAVETFAELLAQVEADGSSDAFYGRLCEAVCRLTSMERAVIFRYDEARRRVRASGAYGIPLEPFADAHLTADSAPVARRALEEDRVIDLSEAAEQELPATYRHLLRDATLVCTPVSAGGRWSGVILSDRAPRRPIEDAERHLLWTLGKTAALAHHARTAAVAQVRARQLQERIDLARDVHESVIQRLFGVQLAFASDAELTREARERIATELQAALLDLRRALQRPLGRRAPDTQTTLRAELARLRREVPGLAIAPDPADVPAPLDGLAQSVLAEAVRNAGKHAEPSRIEVRLALEEGAWVMEVANDGVPAPVPGARRQTGMGLRLAALEALQAGGILEFGAREAGTWRVRLAVPT